MLSLLFWQELVDGRVDNDDDPRVAPDRKSLPGLDPTPGGQVVADRPEGSPSLLSLAGLEVQLMILGVFVIHEVPRHRQECPRIARPLLDDDLQSDRARLLPQVLQPATHLEGRLVAAGQELVVELEAGLYKLEGGLPGRGPRAGIVESEDQLLQLAAGQIGRLAQLDELGPGDDVGPEVPAPRRPDELHLVRPVADLTDDLGHGWRPFPRIAVVLIRVMCLSIVLTCSPKQ